MSYVGLLILIAVLSVVAATTVQAGAAVQRRQAEEELLRIGAEFERALASYKAATPPGASPWPHELQDLLADPRYPRARRHLRSIRPDPMTGRADWRVVRGTHGGVVGVHSASTSRPIKVSGFALGKERFTSADTYEDWLFGDELELLRVSPPTIRRSAGT